MTHAFLTVARSRLASGLKVQALRFEGVIKVLKNFIKVLSVQKADCIRLLLFLLIRLLSDLIIIPY